MIKPVKTKEGYLVNDHISNVPKTFPNKGLATVHANHLNEKYNLNPKEENSEEKDLGNDEE